MALRVVALVVSEDGMALRVLALVVSEDGMALRVLRCTQVAHVISLVVSVPLPDGTGSPHPAPKAVILLSARRH
jgi:hypothetical protein